MFRVFHQRIGLIALSVGILAAACGPSAAGSPATPTAARAATPPSGSSILGALPTQVPAGSPSPASTQRPRQFSAPPPMLIDPSKKYTAIISTSDGSMTADLFAKDAPATVNNFVFLARQGFYDGVVFHRIMKNFMVQTGDPRGNGLGGPGYTFPDEPVTRPYVRGTLAMANSGRNTNGSQFFIIHQDYALAPNYTIFGILTAGLDTLDKLAATPVTARGGGEASTPLQPPTIVSIKIQEN